MAFLRNSRSSTAGYSITSQGQTFRKFFLTHLVFPHRDKNFRSPITDQRIIGSKLNSFVEQGKGSFPISTSFDSLISRKKKKQDKKTEPLAPRLVSERHEEPCMTLNAPFLHTLIVLRSLGGSPPLFGNDTRLGVSCSFSDNRFPGHTCDHIK